MDWKYLVTVVIDVKRTDNQVLTDKENEMVQEMHTLSQEVVKNVMLKYGQEIKKDLGKKTEKY